MKNYARLEKRALNVWWLAVHARALSGIWVADSFRLDWAMDCPITNSLQAKRRVATASVGDATKPEASRQTHAVAKAVTRSIAGLLCIFTASCGGEGNHSTGARQTLTPYECTKLIRREFRTLSVESTSGARKSFSTCKLGKAHYQRRYFDCVNESKYSEPLICLYKERGRDRWAENPSLIPAKTGEYGHITATAAMVRDVGYQGKSPRTSIGSITLDSYLDRRDLAFAMDDQKLPDDGRTPKTKSTSSTRVDGKTYWIVRETYIDLQLMKILLESETSNQDVTCALYGSREQLSISSGFCAALIKKQFNVTLAE